MLLLSLRLHLLVGYDVIGPYSTLLLHVLNLSLKFLGLTLGGIKFHYFAQENSLYTFGRTNWTSDQAVARP
jgi:hypothetical protein